LFFKKKAIDLGLKPIVVVNKVDRIKLRKPNEVQDQVFDLMFSLDATEIVEL
jgi:GTP-binding protein